MKELTQWWSEIDGRSRPWLLLGKGPTFELRDQYDLSPYFTVAINHAVWKVKADAASAVNYEVLADCSEAIYENARFLLMPRYPHTIAGDGPRLLETYFDEYPVLETLSREGRLVWYNLSSDTLIPGSPVVRNGPFSSCILFSLLGMLGVRKIKTLGIDGGLSYGAAFAHIAGRTKLANGMPTYDKQFKDMMQAVHRFKLDYAPLNGWDRRRRLMMLWELFRQSIRIDPGRERRLKHKGLSEEARRA
jgi:hypothetical protein